MWQGIDPSELGFGHACLSAPFPTEPSETCTPKSRPSTIHGRPYKHACHPVINHPKIKPLYMALQSNMFTRLIVVYDTLEMSATAYTTIKLAGSAYGLTPFQVKTRLKSHKKHLKRYLFMRAHLEKDPNKRRNSKNLIHAAAK